MKKLLVASALAAGATLGLAGLSFAHGGTYRGPGDTVPPGGGGGGGGGGPSTPGPSGPGSPGSGPSTPGPAAPGSPGGGPGGAPSAPQTGGGGGGGPDLTAWTFWWEFNKEPYLNLKAHIHEGDVTTGSDGWFLGHGEQKQAKDSLRPSEEQIRQEVVPALLAALENETNNDIVTGCLIALAKIGDVKDESGNSAFEEVISGFLGDRNQEIAETAAVSLGILANDQSIGTLVNLLRDNANGRTDAGGGEISLRTRAFAAYGLALIGARTASETNRATIVENLVDMLNRPDFSTRDIKVACLVSLGLVPLDTIQAAEVAEGEEAPVHGSRTGQLDFVLEYFQNEDNHFLIRAHAPTALTRLLEGMPGELHQEYRKEIAEALLAPLGKRAKAQKEIIQSCVLALGQLGDNDADPLDERIREALIAAPKDLSDQQARNFSLIAAAKAGSRIGPNDKPKRDEVVQHLMRQLAKGRSSIQPWAGMAIGVMGRQLTDAGLPADPNMTAALRSRLADEKNPSKVGAYAIAAGILRDLDSRDILRDKLDRMRDPVARGYICVSLGLMNARGAVEPIQTIVKESKYRPELLRQAAVGLGLLGDKALVPYLIEMLTEAKGLATQAAISSALGSIGDSRSIEPLVHMLGNKDITDRARGFAAVALGIVADKEPLPWNSKIAVDLNYRAATQTLNDQEGTGILNIL